MNLNYKELNHKLELQKNYVIDAEVQLKEFDLKKIDLEKQNNDLKNTNQQLKKNLEFYISQVKLNLIDYFFCIAI